MAEIFEYYCKKCNISIVESAGKDGHWMSFSCKCMKCNSCGKISDILVSESEFMMDDFKDVEPKCKCGSTDVKPWSFTCPQCGRFTSKRSTGLMED